MTIIKRKSIIKLLQIDAQRKGIDTDKETFKETYNRLLNIQNKLKEKGYEIED